MKNKRLFIYLISLTAMVALITYFTFYVQNLAKLNQLLKLEGTIESLRAQELPKELYERFLEWGGEEKSLCYEYMCAYFITGITEQKTLDWYIWNLKKYKEEEFQELVGYQTAIWKDLVYFPVPLSAVDEKLNLSFENSWMTERTYGGKRGHEGTDLMAAQNQRGLYPIISMTDGVVENIGWLTQGGYRIGIRSPNGGYFYYAHLYDYARAFEPGDEIKAGQWIGFMGDSGYSEVEGTVGNFDVHLHVGIYLNEPDGTEVSVNAYWPLKYLETKKLTYQFAN